MLFALQSCRRRLQPLGEEPDTDIQQPLRSKEGLSSSTMANRQSPRHPLPTGLEIDNPIQHTARGDGMGCAHLLNEARAWPIKINNRASPDIVCHVMQGRRGKRETQILRRTFYTHGIFLFLSTITPAPPLVYKREGRAPH